jgi:SAM-dependent methyltransferase
VTKAIEFGRRDAWRDTENLSEAKALEHAVRLEHRARVEDEVAARDEYLGLLGLAPGQRVLDVGCGTGVVTRAAARRVAPSGRVIGVDSSSALLTVARGYADNEGLGALIELRQGDCRRLPFADASFDAALAVTLLAHVPQAERALAELVRVTRPGGRVGVFDFDGDCFLIAHPDRELTRRIVAAHCDNAAVNGRLMREVPAIFTDLGLEDVRSKGFMPLERGVGTFYADVAQRAAQGAAEAGAITNAELAKWLSELQAVIASGRFMGGRLHIFVWGIRPIATGQGTSRV